MNTVLDLHLNANKNVLRKYMDLDSGRKVRACYVWIDGTCESLRSKTRTIEFHPSSPSDLPIWEYDGSSTGQAEVGDSDVYLYPRCVFRDPFRPKNHNVLVLCEALDSDKVPVVGNNRKRCFDQMKRTERHDPWFGFEQEYVIMGHGGRPYGWPTNGFLSPQGPYYCSVGAGRSIFREISEALYSCLLFSGISVYGDNAEVMPSQWEYQIGTCLSIDGPDQLWMSRYILHRVAEDFGVCVSLDPKPVAGNWNGSGCHTNFSTKEMRAPGGIKFIEEAAEKLSKRHMEHLKVYDVSGGVDNARRLSGIHETSRLDTFTWSVSGRSSSVRIPRLVNKAKCGYLEDRRPAGNCDPYLVAEAILNTVCE